MHTLRFAFRSLAKTPAFTAVAVVTLALGAGLNTAMFSLLNVLLLRPLPFAHSESLVRLHRSTPQSRDTGLSGAEYLALRQAEEPFGRFAGFTGGMVAISEQGHPAESQPDLRVSASYFDVLQVIPERGRGFRADEETPGRDRVAIISHALWQSRYGGVDDIVGRTVRIDGESVRIVGVLPAWANDDRLVRQIAIFRPLSLSAAERAADAAPELNVIGRRAPQLSEDAGNSWLAAFGRRLALQNPNVEGRASWHAVDLRGATGNPSGRLVIAMLLGLSGCVLLIACSNLANFLLARTLRRRHQLAVRAALGASRGQLLAPLACEALLLAVAGGLGALVLSVWASDWLSAQSVASGGAPVAFPLDWRVLTFTAAVCAATALACGLAPALFAMKVDVADALKNGARVATAGRASRRLSRALIVVQFALATTLVAGAGFFARGMSILLSQPAGWNRGGLVQGDLELPAASYGRPGQIVAFQWRLRERLLQLPGVQAASFSYLLPSSGLAGPRAYRAEGAQPQPGGQELLALFNGIGGDYFETTGTPLLAGRRFNAADTATAPAVAIVNEAMARSLFGSANPLGRRIATVETGGPAWAEIVGVVGDVRTAGAYAAAVPFQVYHPFAQQPWSFATLAVRSDGVGPDALLAPIRAAVAAIDVDLPLRNLAPASTIAERASSDLAMLTKMIGAFALLGAGLAALGIHGLAARSVAERMPEIGLRIALGAEVGAIVQLVLGSALRLCLIGAAVGVAGAFAVCRIAGAIMPGLRTDGAGVFVGATAILLGIAALACLVPARAAARTDPLAALRAE